MMEWFGQFVHMSEYIAIEKTMKDQFKYIRNRLRTTAWSACMTTNDLSLGNTRQMFDQNTELDYPNIL